MRKELGKTYDPKDIEDRLYSKWIRQKILPRRSKSRQKTIYHCDATTKHHRTASYGTCTGQYFAGYFDPLQENAGI